MADDWPTAFDDAETAVQFETDDVEHRITSIGWKTGTSGVVHLAVVYTGNLTEARIDTLRERQLEVSSIWPKSTDSVVVMFTYDVTDQ